MEKTTLGMLLLAAATIGPQLVAPVANEKVKHGEQLTVEELSAVKAPTNYCVYELDEQKSNS